MMDLLAVEAEKHQKKKMKKNNVRHKITDSY